MGQIVGAVGVPHHPSFPALAGEDTAFAAELRRLYGTVAETLRALRPDVLVMYSSDHLNTFFTTMPTFTIGVCEQTDGPIDRPDSPSYRVDVDHGLGRELHRLLVDAGFDLAVTHEFGLDHTFMVPYHFLAAGLGAAVVPVFINGLMPPVPRSERCFSFGRAMRAAIESIPDGKRIAIIASGSVSLDLGGVHHGPDGEHHSFEYDGVPNSGWVDQVAEMLRAGATTELLHAATADMLASAGNIGGELVNWIATVAALDAVPPVFVERQGGLGNVFAAWDLQPVADRLSGVAR